MHSILRNITLSISPLKCMFYFLLDSQHIFSFFVICYFTRTHLVQEESLHLPFKSNFLTYNTCTWGTTSPPYLSMLVLMFVVSYHLVLMFLWSPIGPLLCGSTIESPLFREYKLSNHRIHGVYPDSLCISLYSSILHCLVPLSCRTLWPSVPLYPIPHDIVSVAAKPFMPFML